MNLLLLSLMFLGVQAQEPTPSNSETPVVSIEAEVLSNVKAQPIGPATVEDLALPAPFLSRVSDRVIRSSYEERYRVVVPDPKPEEPKPATTEPKQPKDPPPSANQGGAPSLALILGTGALLAFLALYVFGRKDKDRFR